MPTGLVASLLSVWTGDGSGYQIAQTQTMKLAAVEGLYEGGTNVGLVGIGVLNPEKKTYNDATNPKIAPILMLASANSRFR